MKVPERGRHCSRKLAAETVRLPSQKRSYRYNGTNRVPLRSKAALRLLPMLQSFPGTRRLEHRALWRSRPQGPDDDTTVDLHSLSVSGAVESGAGSTLEEAVLSS